MQHLDTIQTSLCKVGEAGLLGFTAHPSLDASIQITRRALTVRATTRGACKIARWVKGACHTNLVTVSIARTLVKLQREK